MKAIFALALLLGLGVVVGCGEEGTKKGTSAHSTITTTSGQTTTPAHDSSKP